MHSRANNDELNFNIEDNIFENDDIELENQEINSINTPVNTNNLLNTIKKNMYQALCYYFPIPSTEKLLSAFFDPCCKKLDDFDNLIYRDVENKLRELYKEKEEKVHENKRKEKEKQAQDDNVDEYSSMVVNFLYTPSLLKSLDDEKVA